MTWFNACALPVYTVAKATVWGGPRTDVEDEAFDRQWKLVIDASGTAGCVAAPLGVTMDKPTLALFPSLALPTPEPCSTIHVKWPDRELPLGLPAAWGSTLAATIAGIDGNVAVCCLGGHGRTGTMLAILATFHKAAKKDPVAWVRANYDSMAVETREQAAYVAQITKRKVAAAKEKPLGVVRTITPAPKPVSTGGMSNQWLTPLVKAWDSTRLRANVRFEPDCAADWILKIRDRVV